MQEKSTVSKDIYYFDREKKAMCKEVVLGGSFISWAYNTMSGKIFQPLLYRCGFFSYLLGLFFDSRFSKGKIEKTVNELNIPLDELLVDNEAEPLAQYRTFNDFFYRKLKPLARICSADINELCCPADGRILVYPKVNENSRISVKGAETRLDDLCGDKMDDFINGDVAVVRLCPADYHRYHFPCAANVLKSYKVKGEYHSVNPVALEMIDNVFVRNKREVTILESSFGKIAYIEVGAFGVAGIEQTYGKNNVEKMDEKGYFKFGGSTVVLVFEPGRIEFCQDLLEKSAAGVEVLVKVGQALAFGK